MKSVPQILNRSDMELDECSTCSDHVRHVEIRYEDNFKPVFKKYKCRSKNLDLSEVVDFHCKDVCDRFSSVTSLGIDKVALTDDDVCEGLGLKPVDHWKCFSLKTNPGFIVICNPFRAGCQRYWLKRLLKDVPTPSNKTNINGGIPLRGGLLWDDYIKCLSSDSRRCLYRQLRWVTLGLHYNWNSKMYNPEDVSPMPEDIALLSSFVASRFGFTCFKPEAAIVNYYKMDSTLSGHNDHSELDHEAPLVSMSFGQSAIFLAGGLTKAVTPIPIRLHSGDIVILSSTSRLAYHGVPKILHDSDQYLQQCWGKKLSVSQNTSETVNQEDSQSPETPKQPENQSLGAMDKPKNQSKYISVSSNIRDDSSPSVRRTCTTMTGGNCSPKFKYPNAASILQEINEGQTRLLSDDSWEPFDRYLQNTRLNLSIRQVNVQMTPSRDQHECTGDRSEESQLM